VVSHGYKVKGRLSILGKSVCILLFANTVSGLAMNLHPASHSVGIGGYVCWSKAECEVDYIPQLSCVSYFVYAKLNGKLERKMV
jgi:hypothetical protein